MAALRSISDTPINAKNMVELNDALLKAFNGLCNGTVEMKRTEGIANVAGKMIGVAKVQLANFALRGEVPHIPFLCDGVEIEGRTDKKLLPKPDPALKTL
jgi:hypothetical protein